MLRLVGRLFHSQERIPVSCFLRQKTIDSQNPVDDEFVFIDPVPVLLAGTSSNTPQVAVLFTVAYRFAFPGVLFHSPVFSAKTIYLHVVIAVTKCLLILYKDRKSLDNSVALSLSVGELCVDLV